LNIQSILLSLFCILVHVQLTWAQSGSNAQMFGPPLKEPLYITSGFGEIRPNHFHSGLDLSTDGKSIEVYAAADGWVSRIKVSLRGYGKVIYLSHAEGFTTVYAHLSTFSDSLEAFVSSHQMRDSTYEIELFPDSTQFTVKKGQFIAWSGNTGNSSGPHLHYEVRDRYFEETLHPFFFGYGPEDKVRPTLNSVFCIPKPGGGTVNGSSALSAVPFIYNKQKKNTEQNTKMALPKLAGWVGFGFNATDQLGNQAKRTGIYGMTLMVDSSIVFHSRVDRFAFDDTRSVNVYMNYGHKLDRNEKVHQCMVPENNPVSIYKHHENGGYFLFNEDRKYTVSLIISDFSGNETRSDFYVQGSSQAPDSSKIADNCSDCMDANAFEADTLEIKDEARLITQRWSLFGSQKIPMKKVKNGAYQIGSKYIPLNAAVKIELSAAGISEANAAKTVMLRTQGSEKEFTLPEFNAGWFSVQTTKWGTFQCVTDTTAPKISLNPRSVPKLKQKGKKKSKVPAPKLQKLPMAKGSVYFNISDTQVGVKTVKAFINDRWILPVPEGKGLFRFDLGTDLPPGSHVLDIEAFDYCGNRMRLRQDLENIDSAH
jgi:hypothetical protein